MPCPNSIYSTHPSSRLLKRRRVPTAAEQCGCTTSRELVRRVANGSYSVARSAPNSVPRSSNMKRSTQRTDRRRGRGDARGSSTSALEHLRREARHANYAQAWNVGARNSQLFYVPLGNNVQLYHSPYMPSNPKTNEWKLLKEEFDALVHKGVREDNLEQVLDEHNRRRLGELIAWAAGHKARGYHGPWPPGPYRANR
jgi:hypothetical protein